MALALDGPRLNPRSGPAEQLVVFLHGYGADGNDLIEIGRQWQRWLPAAAFASPHAPELCSMSPMGRQWFALTFHDPGERWRGVNAAAPGLEAFLDAELGRHQLPPQKLALVGFSQGTMMALHVGLRRAARPAAIVGYSGLLVIEEGKALGLPKDPARPASPILLVHGEVDDVIPLDSLFLSADGLAKADIPCEWHLSIGIGHGIDPEGLRHGGLFLTRAFGLPYPAR